MESASHDAKVTIIRLLATAAHNTINACLWLDADADHGRRADAT
jgi:hypothetical protein